ncbi:ABC transporter permease [Exiguobacterium sp. RIT594]|uniref:ABC transporter permease n=1 Tax=Exiguobacterium sp. RIT594 TaxID=2282449 RepID=UPI000DF8286C|nr:ABC transporter permease [Exiguobacterium sp. RIT594]RDB33191.1 ABC transporter permease [Exiguobacterium sp. RIT594]
MNLFKLAFRNLKNIRQNVMYLGAVTFAILIYYTFLAIRSNEAMLQANELYGKLGTVFTGSSVILALFSAIFIWYSSDFFLRRRKQEIGLYALLGLERQQIAKLLFLETMGYGLIGLLIGVVLGTVASKYFVQLLAYVMGMTIEADFSINTGAIGQTVVVFLTIFLVIALRSARTIYRFTLIELFKAKQQVETIPNVHPVLAVVSVLLIGTGYYLTGKPLLTHFTIVAPILMLCIIVGTFGTMSYFTIFLLRVLSKRLRHYHGTNLILHGQLISRIKSNAVMLSTITVITAVTLTTVGTATSIYYYIDRTVEEQMPYSLSVASKQAEAEKLIRSSNQTIESRTMVNVKNVNHTLEELPNPLSFTTSYQTYAFDGEPGQFSYISYSDYQKLAKSNGKRVLPEPATGEAIVLETFKGNELLKESVQSPIGVTFKDTHSSFRITGATNLPLTQLYAKKRLAFAVSDDTFAMMPEKAAMLTNYQFSDERSDDGLINRLEQLYGKKAETEMAAYYPVYAMTTATTGLLAFAAGFLGLVFLLATGSIIYFKMLAEAEESKQRFEIIQKIGVDPQEQTGIIRRSVGFMFVLPYLLGLVHSLFAMQVLQKLLNYDLRLPMSLAIGCYTVVYLLYYLVTVRAYRRIVI